MHKYIFGYFFVVVIITAGWIGLFFTQHKNGCEQFEEECTFTTTQDGCTITMSNHTVCSINTQKPCSGPSKCYNFSGSKEYNGATTLCDIHTTCRNVVSLYLCAITGLTAHLFAILTLFALCVYKPLNAKPKITKAQEMNANYPVCETEDFTEYMFETIVIP